MMENQESNSNFQPIGKGQQIKPHEIYENTNYIPNTGLRLLDIPMNSSLAFQKLLWFHAAYDLVFAILILGACFHKVAVREMDYLTIVTCSLMCLWVPLEYTRIGFGYSGNINETFPELIAFLIFTFFFCLPLSCLPLFQVNLFPHEPATLWIQIAFVLCEFVVGCFVMQRFMQTQSAAFYLRTAPIIDKKFAKKYYGTLDIKSTREIQLGLQKFDKDRDALQPFRESDRFNSKL